MKTSSISNNHNANGSFWPMRSLCGLAMAAIGLAAPLASADTTIPVQDPSFETSGGTAGGPWAAIAALWHPTTTWWGQTYDSAFFTSAADGTWYANFTDNPSMSINQNLLTTVNTGETLAVTFYVGREKTAVGGVIAATFIVGTTEYTQDFDTTKLAQNSWQSYTLTKTIGNTGNLSLKFERVSGRIWLDNISTVTVAPAAASNGEPTSTHATLTAAEDTATQLSADNFGYADPNSPASPLAAVMITSLPSKGTLKNDGVTVLSSDLPLEVAVGNISKLTYQAALNGNGTSYTSIGIKVKSENGIWSLTDADMIVNVTPVNDPPTSTGGSVSMKANAVKTFAVANFQFSDVDTGDTLGAIKITSLPANGTLNLGATPVILDEVVPVASIPTLTYTPTAGFSGSDTFDFKVSDGTDYSTNAATLTVTITVNQVPSSTGGSVILRVNTVKTFAAADFPFADADSGDALSAIKVTSLPANGGTLTLGGTPITAFPSDAIPVASIGTLTYTPPTPVYAGADSFNFQVSDGIDFSANAAMAVTVTSDILVLNGGFEGPTPHNPNNGTTADWTAGGWAFLPAPWTSSYGGNYSRMSSAAMVGTAQPGPWICNLNGSGIWIKQNLGTTVNAGDTLSVTFHVMSDNLPGQITATFTVGSTDYSQTFDNPQNRGTWVPYTLTQTVGEGISGNLSLKFSNVGTTNVNDRLWLDNISNVSVVPAGSGGPVAGSYADWASKNSVTGEASDDSNHDGVPNGIAYFMGVTGLATLPGPDASGTVAWPMSATFSGTHVVETSTDLVTWTSVSTQPTPAGGYLSYTLPKDAVGGKQFVRLVVTPN